MLRIMFCWCTHQVITIECVGIAFTHTSTFVLDINDLGIEDF